MKNNNGFKAKFSICEKKKQNDDNNEQRC